MNRQYGALSGIAIILIVLNHTITAGSTVAPVDGWEGQLLVTLQALGTFAVPTFLFISGAFVAYAAKASKSALSLKFVWGSLERIVIPYLVWSLIYYVVIIFTRDQTYGPLGYIKNLLVGRPYHFVPLLIFYYLVAPILVIAGKRFGWLLLLLVGLYQLFLIVWLHPGVLGTAVTLPDAARFLVPPVLATTMADWAIFFPMGLIFSMHNATLKPRLQRLKWGIAAATAVLFLIGILNAFGILNAPWARFVAPVLFMGLLPVIDRKSIPQVRRAEQVGRRSYGIYLAHFIVLDLTLYLIKQVVPGLIGWPILIYPLIFVAALLLPQLLMDRMSKRPSTRKVYRYVFG